MIGKDDIAHAIASADAIVEEHGDLGTYWRQRNVDIHGLAYVAEQRGLRAVMMLRGENPNVRKPTPIALSERERQMMAAFAASFMDGFAARDRLQQDSFDRLARCAGAALERAEVGDADEATAILTQVVTLDGHYIDNKEG